ncbi:MAG: D-alanyl-D-alanine carboxypeptidase, partial [Chloroflexi bacterium]|nr:D-alanyl-D-alanine carboxypeptidase [Chloroflexota bacterium]
MRRILGRQQVAISASATALALVVMAPGAMHAEPSAPVGSVPVGAQKVMDKEAYATARWLYEVADLKTGEVLLANRPHELVFTGSTAKNFTIASAYAILGPDSRTTTPVYSTSPVQDGVVNGNLVLVASGDLTLGGRGAMQGQVDQSFTATAIDHVYGDIAPNAVLPPGDPLAGLDSLAAQVASKGVTQVQGDVLIDDRLWQTQTSHEGPVPPIFVNDNLLDLTVTPAAVGATASVTARPSTSAYGVQSNVMTQAGSDVKLTVTADPADPQLLLVSGTIGADAGPRLTIYRVPDPASWARTLFIEALGRAGVTVAAEADRPNATANLPAPGTYDSQLELAALTSPPLSATGTMILETSYNTGANTVLC